METLRQEILHPSGVEHAVSLKLKVPCRSGRARQAFDSSETARILCSLVVARSNYLRVFDLKEEQVEVSLHSEHAKERRGRVRRDTEAVEGEVEMDTQGEGFVNMGTVKSTVAEPTRPSTTIKLYFVRGHRLHGIVTGLQSVKVMNEDTLDRLLVSFKDAKIALMEWSEAVHNLITVSIHTYERAPQMLSVDLSMFQAQLRVDAGSRCAVLSLPKDALAVLPFYQSQAELDLIDLDQSLGRDIPYSPSFILDLGTDVDERIRNVVDFVFLPGFNVPTMAILFQTQQTWTGRLTEYKDTAGLFIFTMDLLTRRYPIITAVTNLPHDCTYITPCDPSLGGVIIVSSNSIIYVDQSSRMVALPVNGWASRVSDMPMQALQPEEDSLNLHLEGSKVAFIDDHTLFIILRDGTAFPVEVMKDGKIVSRLSIGPALAHTTIPAVITQVEAGRLFIGSTVGPSVLLKATRSDEEVILKPDDDALPAAVVDLPEAMDLDDDEDIYGGLKDNSMPITNGHLHNGSSAVEIRSVIHLSLCDSLPAHGPISDITFSLSRNGDRPIAELIAATGQGHLGGFTLFQRDLPTHTKRKVHAVGGTRGVWSLAVKQPLKLNGSAGERPHRPTQYEYDSVIVSTDANPSPGLSRVASRSSRNDIVITTRLTATTIGAAAFFQRTAILHVVTDAIRVLEPDGTERQAIKDMEGNSKRPRIRFCSISDPFVLIIRDDDSLGLFVGDAERGKIRRKDMTPMGDRTSRYIAGCFFSDQSGIFQTDQDPAHPPGDAFAGTKSITSSLEATVDSKRGSQWLILCRPRGVMEIWTLPKLHLVFSTQSLPTLEDVLIDTLDPPALSLPEWPPRTPQDLDIEQVLVAMLGETHPKPYLIVSLRCGQIGIYEALPSEPSEPSETSTRKAGLLLHFVKIASRAFEVRNEDGERRILAETKRVSRQLITFVTSPQPDVTLHGVFFTGDQPCWILTTDKGGLKVHPCGCAMVHSFTACSLWESKRDFLLYTDEGPCLLEWMPNIDVGTDLPSKAVSRSRSYSNVIFHATTNLIVAASRITQKFGIFDEDGNKLWEPDAPNVDYPSSDASSLELISADFEHTLDGFEFLPNESVNALECVTLETMSTESGHKDFIVAGTTIDRGEDLAVKGSTYVFEIVEVVPDLNSNLRRNYRLRLHVRDEAKGPVTALCGMNGYLVSSMGQKIFVRALDMDERLVGVAFLDVGVYVTSLRALKNFLLIADAVKSVWFVAFQEDPFKLIILAKDIHQVCVSFADFLFSSEGQYRIVSSDEEGALRLYEYDPFDPESRNGLQLLCRSEFHGQAECRSSLMVANRSRGSDSTIPYSTLFTAATNGSLHSLTPLDEDMFKRLQLLQGQLTRNVQHFAGLNPKAYRIVRNDYVPRPLSKGMLDGNLLSTFEDLPVARQIEITRQIGTFRGVVLKDWLSLKTSW